MSESSVFPEAVGDRPPVKKIQLGSRKRRYRRPGGATEAALASSPKQGQETPAIGGFRPAGAISGPKPSSAVALKTDSQSPSQQWTSRQRGSVFQQKPAALQGRQVQYYVVPRQPRAAAQMGSATKPPALGGGQYGNSQKSLRAYGQWRQGS